MKKNIKTTIIALITILCFSFTSIAFAAGSSSAGNSHNDSSSTNSAIDSVDPSSASGSSSTPDTSNAQGTGSEKEATKNSTDDQGKTTNEDKKSEAALKEQNRVFEQTRSTLKEQLGKLEKEKENLENQYKEAVRTENQGQEQLLKIQLQQKEQAINSTNEQVKQVREQIRETIRDSYTTEEKNRLKELELELKERYKEIKVLPVDSVIAKGTVIKFDTPPVIKEGRTLMPVRALTEGFGADVTWNQAKQEVTIQKEQVRIVLQLGSNLAYVNGEEVKIDVPPETMNNRTVVPLRFIIEKLGLKVEWDNDGQIIEIGNSQSEIVNE